MRQILFVGQQFDAGIAKIGGLGVETKWLKQNDYLQTKK